MKTVLLTMALFSSVSMAADKIFVVGGKVVTPKQAFEAANTGKKVERCSEVTNATFIDAKGNKIEAALKCQEVTLYANKSGLPTWKSVNTGTKW